METELRSTQTVLAVGAAGQFASLVVPALAKRGANVRGLVRDAKQSDAVRKGGASDVVVGDLRDRASVDAALKGVDAVFYIAPAFIPDEVEIGTSMVDAAKHAGVRRFVFSSVIHPILGALVNHAAKAPVEEAIVASDMEFTLLHPALFFQNFARGWPEVLKTGAYTEPWSAETRFSRVDYRDVAEVAAMALTQDQLVNGTFELCSEGYLNRRDVTALMGEALGRTIEVGTVKWEKPAATSGGTAGAKPTSPMEAMFGWYDHHGLVGNSLILRAILGREPRALQDYLAELAVASKGA